MKFMFYGASSFNQNLCPWGPKLPTAITYASYASAVGNMFYNSGCPDTSNPEGRSGPWCAVTNCTANP
jgi:hypothetical protein